jgi:hypothetical protein
LEEIELLNGLFRKNVLLVGLPILVFLGWFGWMSYTKSESDWVKAKVAQAMSVSIQSLAPQWPRIEYHTPAGVYFSPESAEPAQVFDFSRHTLEILNQDLSVPPLKLLDVSIDKEFGDSEDTLIGRATVRFPLFAGIDHNLIVQSSVKIPHYTTRN